MQQAGAFMAEKIVHALQPVNRSLFQMASILLPKPLQSTLENLQSSAVHPFPPATEMERNLISPPSGVSGGRGGRA